MAPCSPSWNRRRTTTATASRRSSRRPFRCPAWPTWTCTTAPSGSGAAPYLRVRDNDAHTIYAYGLARALLQQHPEADPEEVLPGILLHDTGWSQVPEADILTAIAPGAGDRDLVLRHEKEGARIAAEVLADVGHDRERTARVVEIVDGHDSRRGALSLDDALVKDADKLWRLTPHGIDTVMD